MFDKECMYLYYTKIYKQQTSLNSRNGLRTEINYQVESRIHTLPSYQRFMNPGVSLIPGVNLPKLIPGVNLPKLA